MENNVVSVMLWGEEVGKLYWDERNKRAVFNYHPDFIKKGVEIAPLTASVKGPAAKGMPILGNKEKTYQGLPPFLADSLPDRWGSATPSWQIMWGCAFGYGSVNCSPSEGRFPIFRF